MVKIIAEIGINHNGDLDIVKRLITGSAEAGCDLVKFQKRDIDIVYDKDMLASPRDSPWGKTQRVQKEGLEFGQEEYDVIDKFCKEKGIGWFASAWDLNSQKFLQQYDLEYNKIASAMLAHVDLLNLVASEKKHTFISTGMSTVEEIDFAVNLFREAGCPFELMHCTSTYPMEDKYANLRCIEFLRERYKCDVGYSGHEKGGLVVSIAAVTLGATSLERHITLDRTMYGSDQAASITLDGLAHLVDGVRKIGVALGKKEKIIFEPELAVKKSLRRVSD